MELLAQTVSHRLPEDILPVEIWQMVFREVKHAPVAWYHRSLVRIMTVCRSWTNMILPVLYEVVNIQGVKILADLAKRFANDTPYAPIAHIQHIEFDIGLVDTRTCDLIQQLLVQNLANLESITLKLRIISLQTFRDLVHACGPKLASYTTYLEPGNMHLLPRLSELQHVSRLHLAFDTDSRSHPPAPDAPVDMPSVMDFSITGRVHHERIFMFIRMYHFHSTCRLSILPDSPLSPEETDALNPLFESHESQLVTVSGHFSSRSSIFARSQAVRLTSGTFSPDLFATGRLPKEIHFQVREGAHVIQLWKILEALLVKPLQDGPRYQHDTRMYLSGMPHWFTEAERDCSDGFKENTYTHIMASAGSLSGIGIMLVDEESGRALYEVLEQITPNFRSTIEATSHETTSHETTNHETTNSDSLQTELEIERIVSALRL